MGRARVEIICSACGRDTLLTRAPVYDGFKKTGEELKCSSCGHVFADEAEIPFKKAAGERPAIFADEEPARVRSLFRDDERRSTCRHCRHYVVNPFRQWCALHDRDVEATDSCGDMTPRDDDDTTDAGR